MACPRRISAFWTTSGTWRKKLFDGHVASEISLGEAIAWNILKPPKYVLSVYSFQKDLEKYEGRDCRQLFDRLNDILTATWDEMYGYAKAYYEKMGHLNIPKAYTTEDGHSLGL